MMMKDEEKLYNNKFYTITNFITSLFAANVMFLLFILPLLLYIFILNGGSGNIILLLSITIGPALATLFSVMGKLLREGMVSPIKDFLHFYKLNLLQGILAAVIMNTLIRIVYFDVVYFSSIHQRLAVYVMLLLNIFIILIGFYAYPIISRYNIKILYLFKMSIVLVFKKFYISLTCLSLIIIALWIIKVAKIALIGVLFGASIICYIILFVEKSTIDELEPKIKEKYKYVGR